MNETPTGRHDIPGQYEIRIAGHLDPRWVAWFDGLSLTTESGGTTVISGPVVDQSALHGLLQKVRDIGLPLISVTRVDLDPPPPRRTRRSRPHRGDRHGHHRPPHPDDPAAGT